MSQSSPKYLDISLLLIRIAFGVSIILGHGWKKMINLFSGEPIQFLDPIGLGPAFSLGLVVFAEVVCGVFIIIGFKTKWATVPLIITMLVVIFMVQLDKPFNKLELPILFLVTYVCLFLLGSGKYSVDYLIQKK
jgi:putative oxidoreductase